MGALEVLPSLYRSKYLMGDANSQNRMKRLYHKIKVFQAKKYFAKLRKRVASWQPDVIYINTVSSLEFLADLDFSDVPVLLHVHELSAAVAANIGSHAPAFLARPSVYVAVADPVREMLVHDFGIDPMRVSLIHEFVPDNYLEKITASADKTAEGKFVVGGAGSPGWRKGTTLWLHMAAELTRMMGKDQVRFVWVGVRDDIDGIFFKEEARKLKVYEQIEFVPVTKTPLDYYSKFDVFAMTSYEDPCPLVVLENMALKKPVLCFAGSGGAPEEVGDTGIVIENFSPAAMAAAIAELAADPKRRNRLGEQARERVRQHFVASRQAPKMLVEMRKIAGTIK